MAQDAPTFAGKTVTMTIGFGAGGSVDLYGRTLGTISRPSICPGIPRCWW